MITENAKKMVENKDFAGFYYIYTLKDHEGKEVKCFFRPDLVRISGIERRGRILSEHSKLGYTITGVLLVDKTEWYTQKLDYDVKEYTEVSNLLQDLEDDFALGKLHPVEYAMFKGAFNDMKKSFLEQISRDVRHMENHEMPINNEVAIEIVNHLVKD